MNKSIYHTRGGNVSSQFHLEMRTTMSLQEITASGKLNYKDTSLQLRKHSSISLSSKYEVRHWSVLALTAMRVPCKFLILSALTVAM